MCEENKQTFIVPDGSMNYPHELLKDLKILGRHYIWRSSEKTTLLNMSISKSVELFQSKLLS